jgi:hypothetical protein
MAAYSFTLLDGWNLLTIPVDNDFDAETLGQHIGVCDAIAQWDAEHQEYIIHPVGTAVNNFEIHNGYGYFVHVTEDANVSVEGSHVMEADTSIKLGWNIIGWIGQTNNAEGVGDDITGCDTVMKWDAEDKSFIPHPMGTGVHNFHVAGGAGLLVHSNQESIWHQGL